MIFARVCRDTIARCLKFEDHLQAILKPSFDQGPNGKGVKIGKLIEDKIRRKKLKNHFFFCTATPVFFPFIYNFLFGFHVSLAGLESYRPRFHCLISKETAGASSSQLLLPIFGFPQKKIENKKIQKNISKNIQKKSKK